MFRKEFDEKLSQIKDNANANLISYLAKRLIFFYSHSRDVDRIVSLDKQFVKSLLSLFYYFSDLLQQDFM